MTLLCEYKTPIAICLSRCNKDSFGLCAESLVKTISAKCSGDNKNGSWSDGTGLISNYLISLGIAPEQFNIDDGSGLSRENRLSSDSIVKVLADIYSSKSRQIYIDSLAVGGVDGTIAKYFKEQKYKGKIVGKTGFINTVKAFSGIARTEKGDYIFSILTNKANGKTRQAINDIAKAIIDHP